MSDSTTSYILEQERKRLLGKQDIYKRQLKQNQLAIPEDISYEFAKEQVATLSQTMTEISTLLQDRATSSFENKKNKKELEAQFYQLEQQLSKYSDALVQTDEFKEEQRLKEAEWEASVEKENVEALKAIRRTMPLNVRRMPASAMHSKTPNGKEPSKAIMQRFQRVTVLHLLRVDWDEIEKMHPSLLAGFVTTGITLMERRALHEHLKHVGPIWQAKKDTDANMDRKWTWYQSMKSNFQETLKKEKKVGKVKSAGTLFGDKGKVTYEEDFGYPEGAVFENSKTNKIQTPKPIKSLSTATTPKTTTRSEEQRTKDLCQRLGIQPKDVSGTKNTKLLKDVVRADRRVEFLRSLLVKGDVAMIIDDAIPYQESKQKVEEIMAVVRGLAVQLATASSPSAQLEIQTKYVTLAKELERYTKAMTLTPEWDEKQREKDREWEASVETENEKALEMVRKHMPVNIWDLSEEELMILQTPNGKQLPKHMARKFKRTTVLQLLRMGPNEIESVHPSVLEGLRTAGLTLTERRALHSHLHLVADHWKEESSPSTDEDETNANNPKLVMAQRKVDWYNGLKRKFQEMLEEYNKHVEEYGPPDNHSIAKPPHQPNGCSGEPSTCPIKADLEMNYQGDYGFPDSAKYRDPKS